MDDVTRILVHETHEVVNPVPHLQLHQVGHPALVRPRCLLLLGPPPLRPPPPRAHQVRLLEYPVHRRGAQTGHVLVHHPPRQLPMPQLRVLAGVGQHRLLPPARPPGTRASPPPCQNTPPPAPCLPSSHQNSGGGLLPPRRPRSEPSTWGCPPASTIRSLSAALHFRRLPFVLMVFLQVR